MLRQCRIITRFHTSKTLINVSKVFSKRDLVRAHYQVPGEPSDVHKTAVTTPFGSFNFTRTLFGLRNSGQTFQHFIDHVTHGLDFVFVYLDDLLVTSPDHCTHKKTFEDSYYTFSRIRDNYRTRQMPVWYHRIKFSRTSC